MEFNTVLPQELINRLKALEKIGMWRSAINETFIPAIKKEFNLSGKSRSCNPFKWFKKKTTHPDNNLDNSHQAFTLYHLITGNNKFKINLEGTVREYLAMTGEEYTGLGDEKDYKTIEKACKEFLATCDKIKLFMSAENTKNSRMFLKPYH